MAMVSRLADQSERLRRMQAVAPIEDQNFEGEKFRQMSIVPDKEELLDFQAKKNLPVNRIGILGSWLTLVTTSALNSIFPLEILMGGTRQSLCSQCARPVALAGLCRVERRARREGRETMEEGSDHAISGRRSLVYFLRGIFCGIFRTLRIPYHFFVCGNACESTPSSPPTKTGLSSAQTWLSSAQQYPQVSDDFKQVEDGGCSRPCEYQLKCGHACPRRCHPGSHDLTVCPKPCLRQYDECRHTCNLRCHGSEECLPCQVFVTKQMPCNHEQGMACSKDPREDICRSECSESLRCGHRCGKFCGRPCTEFCGKKEVKTLPCGHSAKMSCYQDPITYSCDKPCRALLPDCQHRCKGTCGKCKQGTAHIPCQQKCGRSLPCGHLCGHLCEAGCSVSCPPCLKQCRKRCFHSRCSEPCGNLCTPCREPCSWQCEHHKCEKSCHEICTRPRCDLPCTRLIPECGHPCIGLCGGPTKCRVCHPQTLDVITQMTLDECGELDRFVQLEDCRHVFDVSGLDTWMDSNEAAQQGDGSVAIKLKECPECKTLVWRTHRYSNAVKRMHNQVEDVKKKILGHEQTKRGHFLLKLGHSSDARYAFLQALQQNPGLMEAHFGIGCTFFTEGDYEKAIRHLSFVVVRSSFASSLEKHITSAHDVGVVEKSYGRSSSRARDSIAMQAIVQWASALTKSKEFTSAIELCDAVLGRDPKNQLAEDLKAKAKKGEVQLVVQAMVAEFGRQGHWYQFPNGHCYTIGACGGALELSRCPDCKAQVGGESYRLTAGNRHLNIDGSSTSAWPPGN